MYYCQLCIMIAQTYYRGCSFLGGLFVFKIKSYSFRGSNVVSKLLRNLFKFVKYCRQLNNYTLSKLVDFSQDILNVAIMLNTILSMKKWCRLSTSPTMKWLKLSLVLRNIWTGIHFRSVGLDGFKYNFISAPSQYLK